MDTSMAISKKDLDMSLYYFLDQVFILEGLAVGIIEYFEWSHKGLPIPEHHLSGFMPCIETVENWLALDDKDSRANSEAVVKYENNFRTNMRDGMEGLLEPYGDTLAKQGFFNTIHNIDNMITSFRQVLEKIVPNKRIYFSGQHS